MSEAPRRVAFAVGGVQKGGTTALFDLMGLHLPVALSSTKEAHFFDDEGQDWSAPDLGGYHALFDAADPRPWGEATPIYLYWPQSLPRMAAYNPHMRLVFIFRDPADRAFSHWRMERRRGFDAMPFAEAIREGRGRVAGDPSAPGHHRVYSYVERGFYGAQLAAALRHFPREQMLLLRSADLMAAPGEVLGRVADHLGVAPPAAAVAPLRANVGGEGDGDLPPADAAYLRDLYAEDTAAFRRLSGLEL